MKLFLTLLLCSVSLLLNAQEKSEKTLIVKIDALKLIDFLTFPTIQLSVEKKLSPQFSLIGEVGYQVYSDQVTDTIFLNTRGYKIKLEARYYLAKLFNPNYGHRNAGLFSGLQAYYRNNQENRIVKYHPASNDEIIFNDEYGLKKFAYGLNFTTGYQLSIPINNYNFVLESHLGIGVMYKNVRTIDLSYRYLVDDELHNHDRAGLADFQKPTGTQLNFNLGLRLGIAF